MSTSQPFRVPNRLTQWPVVATALKKQIEKAGVTKQYEGYAKRLPMVRPAFMVATHTTHCKPYRDFIGQLTSTLPVSGIDGYGDRQAMRSLYTLVGVPPTPWVVPHGGWRVDQRGAKVESPNFDVTLTDHESRTADLVFGELFGRPVFVPHSIPLDSQLGASFFLSGPTSNVVRGLALRYFFESMTIDKVGDPDRAGDLSQWHVSLMERDIATPVFLALMRSQQSTEGKQRDEATYWSTMEKISFDKEDEFGFYMARRNRTPRIADARHNLGISLLAHMMVSGYKHRHPEIYNSGAPWDTCAKIEKFISDRGGRSDDLVVLSGDISGMEKRLPTQLINKINEHVDRTFQKYGFTRGFINCPVLLAVGDPADMRFTHGAGYDRHSLLGYGNPSGDARVKLYNDASSSVLVVGTLAAAGINVKTMDDVDRHPDIFVEIHGDDVLMVASRAVVSSFMGKETVFAGLPITWELMRRYADGDSGHYLAHTFTLLKTGKVEWVKNLNTFTSNRLAAEHGLVVNPTNGKVVRASNRIGNIGAGEGLALSSLVYGSHRDFEATWEALERACRDRLHCGIWDAFPADRKSASALLQGVRDSRNPPIDLLKKLIADDPSMIYKGHMSLVDASEAALEGSFLTVNEEMMLSLYPELERIADFPGHLNPPTRGTIDDRALEERFSWLEKQIATMPILPKPVTIKETK